MAQEQLVNLTPSSDHNVIKRRLTQTAEMMQLLRHDDPLPLTNIHDVSTPLRKASPVDSLISIQALQEIQELSIAARRVKDFIERRAELYPELKKISVGFIPLKNLEQILNKAITDHGEISSDASARLQSIYRRLNRKRDQLRTTINRVMSKLSRQGRTSDEGPTIRNGRMVVPVLAEYKRKVKGFVHDVSSTGQTVYLEPIEALSVNNDIRELELEEKREIERILRDLTSTVRRHKSSIRQNMDVLTHLDLIAAKAQLGNDLNASVPVIASDQHLSLEEAYHPLLHLKNKNKSESEREEVIPLNLELTGEEPGLVITGPNAGGKSVALKTLALCCMMMQCGMAIPARDTSRIPIFSSLFVDMGDDQSIENDLSTFSSRLQWMHNTLEKAGEHSLVLIDEAAAGTDPAEGSALFQSLIEQLIKRGAKVLVTTHHGGLKVFAAEHQHIVNGAMEFDQESLSPTYRFKKGVPGSSYAFEIARRMELPENLLERARKLTGKKKSGLETLITKLEARAQEVEGLRAKYEKLQLEMEKERRRYEEKRSGIEKEKDEIRTKALEEAKSIVNKANQKIEQAVQRIVEKGRKDEEVIEEARQEVDDFKEEITEELSNAKQNKEENGEDTEQSPQIGDRVRLKGANTTGELKDIEGDHAVVSAGGLRLKTKLNKLVKVKDASKIRHRQRVKVNIEDNKRFKHVKPELMIRKMRGEEAMKKVQNYLDNAIAAGRPSVRIIHGKGEGILKGLVHEYLEERKEVESYKMAPIQLGGAGCTVVYLK